MKLRESAENYLETIYKLKQQKGIVKSVDIADTMNFSRPSICVAMKKLKSQGFITMDAKSNIELTNSGLEIAHQMYHRYEILLKILSTMGVPEDLAKEDACRMEHDISQESVNYVTAYLEQFDNFSKQGNIFLDK